MPDKPIATLLWHSGMRFVARSPSGHGLIVESVSGPDHLGPSPTELLLIAVAGCSGMDVVSILQKMHEPLAGLEVSVSGERASDHPKYFTAIEILYHAKGRGISREKLERAVSLSQSTYCSVLATLRPDCKVTSRIEISED